MPLHLLKLAVGIDDVGQLAQIRTERREAQGGSWVYTRNRPRRAAEVLAGGSVYWVIRGQIRVRQAVVGFLGRRDEGGRRYCLIEVDPQLVLTMPRPWRPFQGWRYLPPEDAPPDRIETQAEPAPAGLLAELRALGLI